MVVVRSATTIQPQQEEEEKENGSKNDLIMDNFLKNQKGTQLLLEKLIQARSRIDEWVGKEKAKADLFVKGYNSKLQEEQNQIDSLVDDIVSIRLQIGSISSSDRKQRQSQKQENEEEEKAEEEEKETDNVFEHDMNHNDNHMNNIPKQKEALLQQQEVLKTEIKNLKKEYEENNKVVQDLQHEETKIQQKADKVRELKERIMESKKITINDLTRGLINYKYLGLDFLKAENDGLRFCFTQIDKQNPSKEFSFILKANDDNDLYEILKCQPLINATTTTTTSSNDDDYNLNELLHHLNETNDLNYFIRQMRKAFIHYNNTHHE